MARVGTRKKKIDSIREDASKYNDESKVDFDIENLIKSNGIELEFSDSLSFEVSGKLECIGNDKWKITINNKQVIERQRFTMAHEFAHYCLHRYDADKFEDVTFFRSDDSNCTMEKQANIFAGELLMPETLVRSEIRNGETSINGLAKKFKVSPLAMKVRLLSLGYKIKI